MNQGDNQLTWALSVDNATQKDYGRDITLSELEKILLEECNRPSNALFLVDPDGSGLTVVYHGQEAVVLHDDRRTRSHYSSYNLRGLNSLQSSDLVRLSPEDSEDFSFEARQVITKQEALHILKHYVTYRKPIGLYLVGTDGLPYQGNPDP